MSCIRGIKMIFSFFGLGESLNSLESEIFLPPPPNQSQIRSTREIIIPVNSKTPIEKRNFGTACTLIFYGWLTVRHNGRRRYTQLWRETVVLSAVFIVGRVPHTDCAKRNIEGTVKTVPVGEAGRPTMQIRYFWERKYNENTVFSIDPIDENVCAVKQESYTGNGAQ